MKCQIVQIYHFYHFMLYCWLMLSMSTCTYIYIYIWSEYIIIYIFVVDFDSLGQAIDFRIDRRQAVFVCWMQNLSPGSTTPNRQQTEGPLTNRRAIEDPAKNLNSLDSPSLCSYDPMIYTYMFTQAIFWYLELIMARLDIISGWHLTTVRLYRDRWLKSLHIADGCDSQQDFINDRLRCYCFEPWCVYEMLRNKIISMHQ